MIKSLYECGCFDYQKFILNNTKKLSLSNDESVVLIKILDECKDNKTFTIDTLAQSLAMTRDALENALSMLMEKKFYEIFITYDAGLGEESILLEGFFTKVKNILENKIEISNEDLQVIIQYVSTKVNRILTSQEIEIISSLVLEDRYNLKCFENACKKLEDNKKVITIRNIAQVISDKEEQEVRQTPVYVKDFFKSIK